MFGKSSYIIKFTLVLAVILSAVTVYSYADECTHDWVEIDWQESTCEENGYVTYYCSLCHTTKQEVLPLAKHDWSSYKTVRKSTVFKKGKKKSYCYVCGKRRYKSIKKLKPYAKLSRKKVTLKVGKTKKLKVKRARGDKVKSWKSSNKRIATVSKGGKIRAKKRGKATITVTLKSGKKARCKVTVKAAKKRRPKRGSSGSGKVYWTPSGSVYHVSRSCPTLSRSRTVYSGSISQSHKPRCCKVCG